MTKESSNNHILCFEMQVPVTVAIERVFENFNIQHTPGEEGDETSLDDPLVYVGLTSGDNLNALQEYLKQNSLGTVPKVTRTNSAVEMTPYVATASAFSADKKQTTNPWELKLLCLFDEGNHRLS